MAQSTSDPNSVLDLTNSQSPSVSPLTPAPTIQEVDATHFLDLPATGVGSASGVIGDATDPAATQGINFKIADSDTAIDQLTVTVTSSNQAVVSNESLTLTGVGADRNLKIDPTGVGFTDIQVEVSDGVNTNVYTIQYGASDGTANSKASHFHTGTSDASTAIAIDSNYMFVADDEGQVIRLYDRNQSGLPVSEFDFTSALGLTDEKNGQFREVDIEASTLVGDRIYWLGSHSNSSKGKDRPNRSRLFATEIVGSGADAKLEFVGYVDFRQDLINWGDDQGYNFSASAATGKPTEFTDSFNIEGLTVSPDGNTAYIAFRAPNTPTSTRTNALIAPLNNFADLVDGKAAKAVFGAPIELDLGGRGIRSIERNANNEYLIVAGPAGSATGTAPNDFRLYSWGGDQAVPPELLPVQLPDLNTGGSFESIVHLPDHLSARSQIQLLLDNGDTDWYGDGQDSKDLSQANHQKFASVTVALGGDTAPPVPVPPVPSSDMAPTIKEVDTTSHFLDLPAIGGGAVSGVIGDATDPAATQGINFKIADSDTNLDQLTVTVTSSNQAVVGNDSLMLSGVGADRNLKINPTGVGYADIQIEVSDGVNTNVYTIQYGASDGTIKPDASHFHTGTSDASTAIAIDSNYMFVADDEGQVIRLYDRNQSGLPVSEFDFTSALGLTDEKNGQFREVDIEASTLVGDRIYWLGSHSNSSKGKVRPNRSRLFATEIVGSGADAKLEFVGYVDFRQDLINWGDDQGYNFSASAATGKPTEFTDSFNIEGLTVSPDGNTAYIAFRAPNTPTSTRTNALIAPLNNFADLVDGKAAKAVFGAPIELDLGGRGIRSIERNANNEYLIVAGPAGGATGTAPNDFRLYSWGGDQSAPPELLPVQLPDLNTGGSFESIVHLPDHLNSRSQIQLLLDNGDTDWYGDGQDSKDLSQANHQKFASVTVTLGGDTDVMQGSNRNDTLRGSSGDDVIEGMGGSDKIYGDNGNDQLFGGLGNDKIKGKNGNDLIFGDQGKDKLYGGDGDDKLIGGLGSDTINGDDGNDLIFGNNGNDKLSGGDGDDQLHGGLGKDKIKGGDGDDLIFGGVGNDKLSGGDGNDKLYGGLGHDSILGGKGDDIIVGDQGADRLTGGKDKDTFVFSSIGDTSATITDFEIGIDKIDLRTIFNSTEYTSANPIESYVKLVQHGSSTQVKVDVFGDNGDQFKTVTQLNHVDKTALTSDHFVLT